MARVLITCAGSGVGQSVLDSLNIHSRDILIGCDMNENVFAFDYCHHFHITSSIYSDTYIDELLVICKKENVDIVIPGHDHELLLFANNIKRFNDENIKVVVASSSSEIIEISRDKFRWYKFFKDYGCAIVPTYSVLEFRENPDPSIFPAIVKPSGGSASQGIYILNKVEELSEMKDEDIIQPYLFPLEEDANFKTIQNAVKNGEFVQMSEISVQIVFNAKSEMAGLFISKNTLKSGVPIFVDTIDPQQFEYIGEIYKFANVLKEKKVIGPVNLQGRITNRGFLFFEMNMRFTGITGTRAKLGFNEVAFLVNDFLGSPSTLSNEAFNKVGIRQVACLTKPRSNMNINSKKTYAILGGSGFIGSCFVKELIKNNNFTAINLICRDNSYEKYLHMYSDVSGVHIIKESSQDLESRYSQSDVLINLASARANEKDERLYQAIHFQLIQSQKIANAGIPLILNVSSQSVYDQNKDIEKKEGDDLCINNLYAFQKFMGEEYFNVISKNYPYTKTLSLRFSRVIGVSSSEEKPEGFFAKVISSMIKGEKTSIPNPLNKINLIDINDAVGAITYFVDYKDFSRLPSVLNIGGTNLSLKQYCSAVSNSLNKESKNGSINLSDSNDVKVSSMVNSELAQSFGWKNKFSIEDTIKEMFNVINKKENSCAD
ncbi:hypothetical protein BZG02_06225 [Labilibaculum filiforme]|uniref:ATP-grasp domain-containing protein n=1 Tax=Labilibaculum filiforme TaxID=1940526 RepID=A0A2N3I288_9BACT|nr:NAD-dependent epimerase/dehydratase family protein [Labilibaculum filiforme]PKQ64407.1 hypothetical protein BZG02_06225 [Labilibaculum filiforme]